MEALATVRRPKVPASVRGLRPCMISFYFHPDYSGSSIQALNLSRHLAARGLAPFIVAANLSGQPAQDSFQGIPVFRLPVMKSKELQIPSFSASLLRFLFARRDRFDIIHAHGTLQHATASLAARRLRKPSLLKVAMARSDIAFGRQGRLWGPLNRALVRRFDAYIATTEAIAEEFAAERLDHVHQIPNGVDTATFAPLAEGARASLRRELHLPPGPLATFVGIINSRKNVDGLLRVWQNVCARNADAHLVLVGPTPGESDGFYASIRSFVESSRLQHRVTFTGYREPVVPYLRASDVFLFPSRREGMPNSVLEAMACALPCVVSESAGVAGIIRHGVNGFALDVDDESGCADTLARLLTDPALRRRVGAEARRTVETRFSLGSVADRYCALYADLISARC